MTRRGGGGVFIALVAAVALSGAPSCSLALDTEATQCGSDADCDARGGAFSGSLCKGGVCSPCASHIECSGRATPRACACSGSDARCVELFSAECPTLVSGIGDVTDPRGLLSREDVVLIGTLLQDDGQRDTNEQRLRSVRLALEDVSAVGGVPAVGNGPARRLAAVACDAAEEPLLRSARHLTERLKVPAIIGPSGSGRVLKVATEVTIRGGALLIAPSATSPTLTTLDDHGLVWRTAPSDVLQAQLLRLQIPGLEQRVRARSGTAAPVRLAVVAKGDTYGKALADLLVPTGSEQPPTFNGKPLDTSASYYRSFVYPADKGFGENDLAALAAFAPEAVVVLATSDVVGPLVAKLEERVGTGFAPEYLFADGVKGSELRDLVVAKPSLVARVRGTAPAYRGSIYKSFVSAYRGAFGGADPTAFGTAGAFDATYMLALSLAATAEGGPPTGERLVRGFEKLVQGGRVEARNSELGRAFVTLRGGSSVDLVGASGNLDFDLATGEAVADIALWCLRADASSKVDYRYGPFLVASSRTLEPGDDGVDCSK